MSTPQNDTNLLLAPELSEMMADPVILDRLATDFIEDQTSTAILRLFAFTSYTIARLEEDLAFHRAERDSVFGYAIADESFRRTLRPIVRHFRSQFRTHPYHS
jgi:hypothetical protein